MPQFSRLLGNPVHNLVIYPYKIKFHILVRNIMVSFFNLTVTHYYKQGFPKHESCEFSGLWWTFRIQNDLNHRSLNLGKTFLPQNISCTKSCIFWNMNMLLVETYLIQNIFSTISYNFWKILQEKEISYWHLFVFLLNLLFMHFNRMHINLWKH